MLVQNILKISEIFESIQGEGKFAGVPMLFIRLSGCNRRCLWCDSKYSWSEGQEIGIGHIISTIKESKLPYVCWSGGEPLLQRDSIYKVIEATKYKFHCLETNGDFLDWADLITFNYIAVSPKDVKTAVRCVNFLHPELEIKVVTDLENVGIDMLQYATMLMPLSNYNEKDNEILYIFYSHVLILTQSEYG